MRRARKHRLRLVASTGPRGVRRGLADPRTRLRTAAFAALRIALVAAALVWCAHALARDPHWREPGGAWRAAVSANS